MIRRHLSRQRKGERPDIHGAVISHSRGTAADDIHDRKNTENGYAHHGANQDDSPYNAQRLIQPLRRPCYFFSCHNKTTLLKFNDYR